MPADAEPGQGRRAHHDPAGVGGARHGIAAPRGLAAPTGSRGGRFSRMFPFLPRRDPGDEAVTALAAHMEAASLPEIENSWIAAGYTYLGQFIDHDITFDATSKIDRDNDPHALVNFRTPRLDLDSLYGSGPADQPFLYDWDCGPCRGAKLLVGENPDDGESARVDLPRNRQGRATIAEGRNDENLLVSQLHLLFIQLHNRVVAQLHGADQDLIGNELFDQAHRTVRWHYQWIVVHDFLPKVLGRERAPLVLANVGDGGRGRGWEGSPAIPVEFSAAAYRFGHSMVRRSYALNDVGLLAPQIMPTADAPDRRDLGGFRRLPDSLAIDWPTFFGPHPLPSLSIDHRLSHPLFKLPPDDASLALLNLQRGRRLGLPSGRDVALAMGEVPLSDDELLPHEFWPADGSEARAAILRSAPLWFYVLREADAISRGESLGPVGGRIVAEVLVGLLEADRSSYLHAPGGWKPWLTGDDFTMANLVDFTLRGDHHPAGGDGP